MKTFRARQLDAEQQFLEDVIKCVRNSLSGSQLDLDVWRGISMCVLNFKGTDLSDFETQGAFSFYIEGNRAECMLECDNAFRGRLVIPTWNVYVGELTAESVCLRILELLR